MHKEVRTQLEVWIVNNLQRLTDEQLDQVAEFVENRLNENEHKDQV